MRFLSGLGICACLVVSAWSEEFVGESFSFAVPPDWKVVSRGPSRVNLRHRLFLGGSYVQIAYLKDQTPAQAVKFFLDFYGGRGLTKKLIQKRGVLQWQPFQSADIGHSRLLVVASPKQGSYSARLSLDALDGARRVAGVQAMQAIMSKLTMKN